MARAVLAGDLRFSLLRRTGAGPRKGGVALRYHFRSFAWRCGLWL